jgi:NitT/TauT family transport system substrate-binding protein
MNPVKGTSEADGWFNAIAAFMQATGAITSVPPAKDYVTDEFMKMVNADKKLRDFAANTK